MAAIETAELPVLPKSACSFWLKETHPDLLARAVAMEPHAADTLMTVKGLGRRSCWEQFVSFESDAHVDVQQRVESPRVCHDGGK